ncbi:flagellar assembly protein FliH [Oceanospirillum sanctuarii]|uniref:flagellar assembly protein FliH n=1 Tax=Oceanospirillum sanctuarii TaxID=1434821 RepID=UPI000A3C1A56|nr:flagellar assembly protein FliH [Oceanospirillum sanctuarii]
MSLDKRHLWSSEEIEAFERWEMPDLTGVSLRSLGRDKISDEIVDPEEQPEEEVEEEIHLPTLEEVEAIRKEAYDAAYTEGMEQGRLDGFEQGREDGFLKGKAEGYEEGSEKGYADGMQQGEREVNDILSRLNSILALLHEPIAAQHEELEAVLYDLLTHLVTLVTRQELSIDSSVVTQIIQDSLAALPRNSDRIRVFVNPDDYSLAQEQASRQIDPWQVFADEGVARGGCRVETLSSLVDSSVETRLEDLLQQVVAERYAAASASAAQVSDSSSVSEENVDQA